MARLFFDYDNIKTSILPDIDRTIENLNTCCRSLNNLSVPSRFSGSGNLRAIARNINDIKNKILYTKNWLNDSKNRYERVLENSYSELNAIKNPILKQRENIIAVKR